MSFFIVRMAAIVHTRFRAIQDYFGDISNFIQENLSGIRVIKAYVQGPAQSRVFEGLNQEYLKRNAALIHTHAIYRPLSFLIASIGLGMNLWLGGKAVVAVERLDPDVVIRDRGQRLEGAATQGRAGQVGPVVTGGGLEPGRQTHRLGGRGHPLMVGEGPLRVGGPVTHDRAADGTGAPARMVP
jgi:ABC-type multidrug transport system fused ATPase/permease subunit